MADEGVGTAAERGGREVAAAIGRVGVWTWELIGQPTAAACELAADLEGWGYGALWVPEAVGRDPLVCATLLLGATERVVLATGIASIHLRIAKTMASTHKTIEEAFPRRFLLGLGVSHGPLVEGMLGMTYERPLATMRSYLDAMDGAIFFGAEPTTPPRRVLAALGPKMLELAATRADGAHPYLVTPEHTAEARVALGPDPVLAPEQAVCLETDPAAARAHGRQHLATYLGLPNYTNNWMRLGFTDADLADGGSDRLVDALVAWGDVDAIAERVGAHHDAGADHVCLQVLGGDGPPRRQWQELGAALSS
jgi:probable F420-dependent oxidoreductase